MKNATRLLLAAAALSPSFAASAEEFTGSFVGAAAGYQRDEIGQSQSDMLILGREGTRDSF